MLRYITTPIYYVNDSPHIGHAYTTIAADMIKRYYTMCGDDVYLLTGTDEHGQKIERAAMKAGLSAQDFVNGVSARFKSVWDDFGICYDKFNRTTNKEHALGTQKAFSIMHQKGDIYKGEYVGKYCVSCESFFVGESLCPDCGRASEMISEESYFFALSRYQDRLLAWYESSPDCILPSHKKNEVIRFVEGGLQDLSITRTGFSWGVALPGYLGDDRHVIYVWLDALMNYANALGYCLDMNYPGAELSSRSAVDILRDYSHQNPCLVSNMEYFDHTTHIVGKDILRFHAVYWPAMLMSLGLPLPRHIYVHGWWTIDGVKMSKSIGNVIDPMDVRREFGSDVFRYFLLREIPFGQDGDYSRRSLIARHNGELSNDLGNLLNRLIGMAQRYFDCDLDHSFCESLFVTERERLDSMIALLHGHIEAVQFHKYLEGIWDVLCMANGLITRHAPWELIKHDTSACKAFLNLIFNILAKSTMLLYPVMPDTCLRIAGAIGIVISPDMFGKLITDRWYETCFRITKIPQLFPKIDLPSEPPSQLVSSRCSPAASDPSLESRPPVALSLGAGSISKRSFDQIDMRLGTVVSVDEIQGSVKLLKLRVDLGEGRARQIVSGIRQSYPDPGILVGMQVCVVVNLPVAKLMGHDSEGMILTCQDSRGISLLRADRAVANGSKIT